MIQILFKKVPPNGEYKLNDVQNHISMKAAMKQVIQLRADGYEFKLWDTGHNLMSEVFRGV